MKNVVEQLTQHGHVSHRDEYERDMKLRNHYKYGGGVCIFPSSVNVTVINGHVLYTEVPLVTNVLISDQIIDVFTPLEGASKNQVVYVAQQLSLVELLNALLAQITPKDPSSDDKLATAITKIVQLEEQIKSYETKHSALSSLLK